MIRVPSKDEPPHSPIAHRFEGHCYGDVNISFFLVDSPPGSGAGLHTHPYEEVFVVQEGEATFTVGDDTIEVGGGQIVVVPAGVPHTGLESTRQIPPTFEDAFVCGAPIIVRCHVEPRDLNVVSSCVGDLEEDI